MKKRKIIVSIILIIVLILSLVNISNGASNDPKDKSFYDGMKNVTMAHGLSTGINDGIGTLIGLLQFAGTGISIIMVTVLGIKYLLAGVDEKAEIKKHAVPIVIGAIFLFGATTFLKDLEKFASTNLNK